MLKRHLFFIIFAGVAIIAALLFVGTNILQNVEAKLSPGPTITKAKEEPKVKPEFDTTALTVELDKVAARYPNLDIGIAVTDLTNGQKFVYGETAPFEAASTTKILTALTLLHAIEQGKYSLNKTMGSSGNNVSSLLEAMIEVSDNDAWVTIDLTIGYAAIRAYATEIGLASYSSKTNTLSTADTAMMLQKLYTGQLLNKENTELLLGHMAKANNKYIGTALSSTYTIYHKTGYLEDRLMDSAIIKSDTGAYVLVIFTKTLTGAYDFTAGKTLFNAITAQVNYSLANL